MQLDTASEQRVRCVVLGVPRCVELAATANTWAMCEHLYPPVPRGNLSVSGRNPWLRGAGVRG